MYLPQTPPAHGMPPSPAAWSCVTSLSEWPVVAVPTQGWSHCQAPVPMSPCRKGHSLCTQQGCGVCPGAVGTVTSRVLALPAPSGQALAVDSATQHHPCHIPCQSHPIPPQDRSRDIPSVAPPGARLFPSPSLVASLVSPHSVPHTPGALLAQPGSNV